MKFFRIVLLLFTQILFISCGDLEEDNGEIEFWRGLTGVWYLGGDNDYINGEKLEDRLPILTVSYPYDLEGNSWFFYEQKYFDRKLGYERYDELIIEGTVNIKNHCHEIDEDGKVVTYLEFKIDRISNPYVSLNSKIWSKIIHTFYYEGDGIYTTRKIKFDGFEMWGDRSKLYTSNFRKEYWILPDRNKFPYLSIPESEKEIWNIGKL